MENNTQLAVREKESKQLVFAAQKQFEVSNEYKMCIVTGRLGLQFRSLLITRI